MRGQSSRNAVKTASGLAALALLAACAVLIGWQFDVPALYTFYLKPFPLWPLTAIGYFFVAAGFLAMLSGRNRLAGCLWAVPVAVGVVALFQTVSGITLGIDTLLYPNGIARYPFGTSGLPGVNAAIHLLMLPLAAHAPNSKFRFLRDIGALIAAIPLALGIAAAVVLMLVNAPAGPTPAILHFSLPSAVLSTLLASAILLVQGGPHTTTFRADARIRSSLVLAMITAAVILPAVPALFEPVVLHATGITPTQAHVMLVLFNVLAVSLITFWAVRRVGTEQAVRAELIQALDGACVALSDEDGRILYWSLGCRQLFGWSEQEAVGAHFYVLLRAYCPDWRGSYALPDADGAQELVGFGKDGRTVHLIERQFHMTHGDMPATVHSLTDITERVSALQALRASEERLAQATAAHELGVFEWDLSTNNIDWSPGTEQRMGLPPGTLATFDAWRDHVEPEDLQGITATVAKAIAERAGRFAFRYRILQPQGGIRAIEGSARAFYDSEGRLVRIVGAILDITEREEREAALRHREAQLRMVLETVPDAMVVLNGQGMIQQFSTAAEALWGYRAEVVIGRHFAILGPPEDAEANKLLFREFLERGDGPTSRVFAGDAMNAAGRPFPVEVRAGTAHSDGDLLITIFVRDLSERVAAEQRLSELNAEIAHVSRQSAMSEMAADLAHELNQPLSATANFLAAARMLLERGEGGDRVTDLLRLGSEQTQRAGEIIRRLRSFVARGEVEMRVESVERTVRDAVDLVLVGTGQFNVRVNIQMDPAAPFILADRIQVQQILVNLLRNAVQALKMTNRDDRQITISSERIAEQMMAIMVTDSGPGIPAHILESLFSRFSTTKGGGGGMGIGLSISKRIIEAHGGTLTAENHPGGGASFRFTLPAVEEGEEE